MKGAQRLRADVLTFLFGLQFALEPHILLNFLAKRRFRYSVYLFESY